MNTQTTKPAKLHLQIIAAAREVGESVPKEGVNQWLINYYKRTTGAEIFRTFSEWKKDGYHVTKGEKGFPVFSRPVGVIKQEAGKEATEQELSRFGTAYLFNERQVLKN
jgi:hypothetical protein